MKFLDFWTAFAISHVLGQLNGELPLLFLKMLEDSFKFY